MAVKHARMKQSIENGGMGGNAKKPPLDPVPQQPPAMWNVSGYSHPVADASFILGVLSSTGVAAPHVERDEVTATRWFARAAALGSLEGHLAMALRYESGRAAPKLCQRAVEHLKVRVHPRFNQYRCTDFRRDTREI